MSNDMLGGITLGLKFPTWRTVKLGTHQSVADFVTALEAQGNKIGNCASQMFVKVALATEPVEIELVVISGLDVGLQDNYTTARMYAAAKAHDLSKCPAEVGLALREQYADQPKGEWLLIAMGPITGFGGRLDVFVVEHDGVNRWLSSDVVHPFDVSNAGLRWVFSRSKQ